MFITKAVQDAMNEQINKEMYSAYLYLSMAVHFETQNLGGFTPLDAPASQRRDGTRHEVF